MRDDAIAARLPAAFPDLAGVRKRAAHLFAHQLLNKSNRGGGSELDNHNRS